MLAQLAQALKDHVGKSEGRGSASREVETLGKRFQRKVEEPEIVLPREEIWLQGDLTATFRPVKGNPHTEVGVAPTLVRRERKKMLHSSRQG